MREEGILPRINVDETDRGNCLVDCLCVCMSNLILLAGLSQVVLPLAVGPGLLRNSLCRLCTAVHKATRAGSAWAALSQMNAIDRMSKRH